MIKVREVVAPVTMVTSRLSGLGQAQDNLVQIKPIPTTATAGPVAVAGFAAGGLMLTAAALMVVSGMYFFRTAPKEKKFWKGWGYVNGVLSYIGAGGYALGGLAVMAGAGATNKYLTREDLAPYGL